MEAGDTYCMIAELGHDVLHRLLVLFQQRGQLLVFLEQGVVLDDSVRILSFELRLECLCSTRSDEQERTQRNEDVLAFRDVYIDPPERAPASDVLRVGLHESACMNARKQRGRRGVLTLREWACDASAAAIL